MLFIFSKTILILLGLFGFLLASYIHNKKTKKKKLVCPLRSDCDTVINSDYSRIFGIPVEVLGMFYYAFTVFSYGILSVYSLPEIVSKILFLISLFATVFSLYLIYLQAFRIKQWCMWCMCSALISLLICVVSLLNYFVL